MSRIGKKNILIPAGVEILISNAGIEVKGPKGILKQFSHPRVKVSQENNEISVRVIDEDLKTDRALWGLYRSLIKNMVTGVTEGYSKKLEINGIGYKVAMAGNIITLNLGYSHVIDYKLREGITGKVEKNTIVIGGIDKQLVGQVSAEIRALKKPDVYLGKGVKYADEVLRKKAGKAAAKGA